jgi:DNA-directed RNA polymerase specialized sigma24 family protein
MSTDASVTYWIDLLKAGDQEAAQPLWERYFARLVSLAQKRLRGAVRAVADEEDVALSAFKSFCQAAERGRFPKLNDRDDLWRLLVVMTRRKISNQVRDQNRLKRGGGLVRHEASPSDEDAAAFDLAQHPGREPSPAFAAQVADEVQRLLKALDDPLLQALALGKMEGNANEELARQHELALRSVERKLGLIRKIWEAELKE